MRDEIITILVVDDNQDMAAVMADILEANNFKVFTAHSGAAALKIMAESRVDILLTDIKMPEMNGLELHRDARKIYPRLITVFMTAYAADDLIQLGMAEGVKTVLTKPVDIKFLLLLFNAHRRIILDEQ
jgi:two-component system, NtrC family, response regulator